MSGKLYYITFFILLFLSCGRNNKGNSDNSVLIDSETLLVKKKVSFNADKFALQLDSLVSIFKDNSFENETDTLAIKTSNENLAELKNGLFKSLYSVTSVLNISFFVL